MTASNQKHQDEPTNKLFFIERTTETKKLNILHQVWRKPNGQEYLREVGKLSADEAQRLYGYAQNDFSTYRSGALKA